MSIVDNEFEIFAQALDGSSGNQTGPNDVRLSDMGPDGNVLFGAFDGAIAFKSSALSTDFLIVWEGDDNSVGLSEQAFEIFGQRFTLTAGPTPTPTVTASSTATATQTQTATATKTPTPTNTLTATPSRTPTPTITNTPGGPTNTPTATPSRTPTLTVTNTPGSPTNTATPTATPVSADDSFIYLPMVIR